MSAERNICNSALMTKIEQPRETVSEDLDSTRDLESLLEQIEAHVARRREDMEAAMRLVNSRLQQLEARIKQSEAPFQQVRESVTAARQLHGRSLGLRSSLINRVNRWLRTSLDRMSDDEVLRALEAQSPAETTAEILVAAPQGRSAAENDWAELLLRGAEAKNRIAELVGGLLSSSEAAAILGISVPGVKQRMDRQKLLAVPLAGGQWGFPALQFAEGGRVRPGVPEVAKAGVQHDPWTVLSILVDDVADGSGILLERLDDPDVLRDVLHRLATYGEHVGA